MSLIRRNNGGFPTFRNMFSDLLDSEKFFDTDFFKKDWVPAVNVKENDNNFEIDVAAPGLKKEDFNVTVDNGVLTISSEAKTEKEEKEDNFTRKEFSYSAFSRSFTLPENVQEEGISAKYEDGVLKLSLAKTERSIPPKSTIPIS